MDAVGVAQEYLHSIKTKRVKVVVMKLNLNLAYDCMNWDFLKLVLL